MFVGVCVCVCVCVWVGGGDRKGMGEGMCTWRERNVWCGGRTENGTWGGWGERDEGRWRKGVKERSERKSEGKSVGRWRKVWRKRVKEKSEGKGEGKCEEKVKERVKKIIKKTRLSYIMKKRHYRDFWKIEYHITLSFPSSFLFPPSLPSSSFPSTSILLPCFSTHPLPISLPLAP